MTGVINTGSFPLALWPGVNGWWGSSYQEHGLECKELFTTKQSDKAYEEVGEITGFGLAPRKPEGESVKYDSHSQGVTTRYTNDAYALGFIVTYEELKDNKYMEVAESRTKGLAFSCRTTKEIVGANVYSRATSGSFLGADGVSLLSTAHPTVTGGTQSNRLSVDADMSEASLEDLCIQIAEAKNTRDLQIALKPTKLVIPPALMFEAQRILRSDLQSGTANNDINALRSMGMIPTIVTNHYLTDSDAFFIRTDAPEGMTLFDREAISISEDNDFDTKNFKVSSYERYVFGYSDWRGLFGSPGI